MIPLIKTKMPPRDSLMPALEKVLYSGYIAQGETVDTFESSFSNFIGNPYCVSVNCGTAALHIALILAGVKPGDEVISTPITAEPTNTAIMQAGGKIIWADIDQRTGNIDPDDVEKKINHKTKAIMVVDYAGIPVNVARFLEIERKYGIPIIEDAAHALGAKYKGTRTGNYFQFTIFSFQAIKHLTTVDGGMLTLKSKDYYEKAKLIRWFGIDKKATRLDNDIKIQGYKYHMNNVNAIIGLVQMEFIEDLLVQYIENGCYFDLALQGVVGVELMEYYPTSEPSYWLYTMKVKNRHGFMNMMEESGVMASELHKRNDSHSLFVESRINLPNVDQFSKEMVHIPCGWWVGETEREHIVKTIKSGW
jgi:perosamine synthetase